MRVHLKSSSRAREAAAKLRAALAAGGHPLSLSRSQEALARCLGFDDWHALRSVRAEPSPLDHEIGEADREARARFQAERLATYLGLALPDAVAAVAAARPSGDSSRDRIRPGMPGSPNPWMDGDEFAADSLLASLGALSDIPPEIGLEMESLLRSVLELGAAAPLDRAGETGDPSDWRKAAAALHAVSAAGALGAAYNLANILAKGEGVGRDETAAIRLFRRVIDGMTRDPPAETSQFRHLRRQACVNLGSIYQYGEQVGRDLPAALALYRQAMEEGEPVAGYNVAVMNMHRWGCETNVAEMVTGLKMAADGGIEPAGAMLGTLRAAFVEGPEAMAVAVASLASGSEGWARDIVLMNKFDRQGRFYDLPGGIEIAERCVADGMPGCARVGIAFLEGHGGCQAVIDRIHRQLATVGDPVGCLNTAVSDLGKKGRAAIPSALRLLRLSIAGMSPSDEPWAHAHMVLGGILTGEHGPLPSGSGDGMEEGIAAFRVAAAGGMAPAAFALGMLLSVDGPRADIPAAAAFYRAAADLGHLEARTNLGVLHFRGGFPEADRETGRDLLEGAAADGDGVARHVLETIERVSKRP